ncbi:hypothetical protein pEaSNUABM9_00246 [Erwinia phage pEa_SNUABM_9]|nr:hypothetical protein pEaSNUABM9_00246 [Erwinia phage pEa_SNUABM_9]
MNTDTMLPEQPSAELVIDYVFDVVVEVKEHTNGATSTKTETVYGRGLAFKAANGLFAADADIGKVFHRWINAAAMVTASPVKGTAPFTNPMALQSYRRVDEHDVCGALRDGHLHALTDEVILETYFFPTGPKGEKLRRYMKVVPHITLRARVLTDEQGKITGVPGWDVVLPDNWELVGRERQTAYNTPTHPDFVKAHGLIHERCKEDGLDYSLNYEEGDDMWNFSIRPMEHEHWFRTGDCSLSNTVEEAFDHLGITEDDVGSRFYNDMSHVLFIGDMTRLKALCKQREVGFSLNYNDVSDTWYVRISSAAQSENFIGKDRALSTALADGIAHLEKLGG